MIQFTTRLKSNVDMTHPFLTPGKVVIEAFDDLNKVAEDSIRSKYLPKAALVHAFDDHSEI